MSGLKDAAYGDRPAAYPLAPGWQRDSNTSREAAASMRPHFGKQHKVITDWLDERGSTGGTYTEICTGTGLAAPSVCGRMVELVEGKQVVKSETTRLTPSGRKARVYVLKEFANQGERS